MTVRECGDSMLLVEFEPVIFVEGGRTGLFLEDKDSVTYYDAVVERLDQLALDEEQSRAVINGILEGLE